MLRNLFTTLRELVLGARASGGARQHPDARQLPREVSFAAIAEQGSQPMNAAYEQLIQHFNERDIQYLTSADQRSICADFRCEVGLYRVVAVVEPEDRLFQVFGYSPVRVPVGSRGAIAETIVRANYRLKVGKFEMDYDEGDVRFQAAQILPDDNLDDGVIQALIGTTISMLNLYLPAVLSVIYGNELPADAIRCVEGRPPQPDQPDS
jgi:hypothetical protein